MPKLLASFATEITSGLFLRQRSRFVVDFAEKKWQLCGSSWLRSPERGARRGIVQFMRTLHVLAHALASVATTRIEKIWPLRGSQAVAEFARISVCFLDESAFAARRKSGDFRYDARRQFFVDAYGQRA